MIVLKIAFLLAVSVFIAVSNADCDMPHHTFGGFELHLFGQPQCGKGHGYEDLYGHAESHCRCLEISDKLGPVKSLVFMARDSWNVDLFSKHDCKGKHLGSHRGKAMVPEVPDKQQGIKSAQFCVNPLHCLREAPGNKSITGRWSICG
ncbi:hypothetical protein BV22DRAFT_1040981 [Leucogyrophana mollusca]|uniref:Uncharacterized protein n=1 Tax=Leucogyrophana mollusca TaxID=85980 RepID=A0ACB8B3C5_9AGAM|nr:hypothetical protein BV22DRAFT_1040981 [Leucogyrophana mollusca]